MDMKLPAKLKNFPQDSNSYSQALSKLQWYIWISQIHSWINELWDSMQSLSARGITTLWENSAGGR